MAIGDADAGQQDRPVQLLLANSQSRYAEGHADHYVNVAILIQNMQGLQAWGNVILPWQPDQADLIVHKVQIMRAGEVIDLLANGHRFTVLRRENNIERATLDGVLTAVMPAEGLEIGDILILSWTMRRRAGAFPFRGENYFFLTHGQPIRRLNIRQIWPVSIPMNWRATGRLEQSRTRTTGLGTELSLQLDDAEIPPPPALAPPRFQHPSTLQLSQFRDWSEISAMFAPYYRRAQQLAPNSPVGREIARLAAASPDPRARAMAALRLVQDRIRYLALAMGEGNYVPATAEQTWARRYADCKGKTTLLLALLHGLGIEAEPVLVNLEIGDSLGERLPMLLMFNHVIVRARIDGRSYWLDGTRLGDRNLEELASSTLGWGLPVSGEGSALERLPYAPPSQPLDEVDIVYDGSAGLAGPLPFRMEHIYRGDVALQMRQLASQMGRDEFLRQMRAGFVAALPNYSVASIDMRDDAESGSLAVVVAGQASLAWSRLPGTSGRHFRFSDTPIRQRAPFTRPEGSSSDAPFALPAPAYFASTETVILPEGGRGFAMVGTGFDGVVAGMRIVRRLDLSGGRATLRSELRVVEREVSAETARASVEQFEAIEANSAYLRATSRALGRP